MNAKAFFMKVAVMREAQKQYFRTRDAAALRHCRQMGKLIDDEIKRAFELQKEKMELKLF